MKIEIERSKVNHLGKQISENASDLEDIKEEMIKVTSDLASFWEGDSYIKFQQKIMEQYVPSIEEFVKCLQEYSMYLQNAVMLYQKLETTFTKKDIEV